MRVRFDLRKIGTRPYNKPVVSLGTFDGVHLGHRAILEQVKQKAQEQDTESLVVTYEPHPQSVVSPQDAPLVLTTLEEKLDLLDKLGIDETVVIDFDKELSNYSAERFVQEILVDRLDPGTIIIGQNHGFGKDRLGDIDLLIEEAEVKGFGVEVVPPIRYEGEPISSTRIRNNLSRGNFKQALEMSGHSYPLYGEVIRGQGRGEKMGYPTANLRVDPAKLFPGDGVYAAQWSLNDRKGNGMTYIGTKPTFGYKQRAIEIHLFDFEDSISTGEEIKLSLRNWVREELKFKDAWGLEEQLRQDELRVRDFFRLTNT